MLGNINIIKGDLWCSLLYNYDECIWVFYIL